MRSSYRISDLNVMRTDAHRRTDRQTNRQRGTENETEKNISVGLSDRISFLVIVIFVTFIPGAELEEEFNRLTPVVLRLVQEHIMIDLMTLFTAQYEA